jgi:hypothetical protein
MTFLAVASYPLRLRLRRQRAQRPSPPALSRWERALEAPMPKEVA